MIEAYVGEVHTAVLRAITQEQPRSALDEVMRELFRRADIKVIRSGLCEFLLG